MGESIWECFHLVRDPRVERTRKHELHDILVIAICAVICGAEGWCEMEEFGLSNEDWFREFLDLPHGIPSHDTFGRVFAALDPDGFEAAFRSWVEAVAETSAGKHISIDGKTLRHSFDTASGRGAIHMVSAWVHENHACFGQIKVDEKSNEITRRLSAGPTSGPNGPGRDPEAPRHAMPQRGDGHDRCHRLPARDIAADRGKGGRLRHLPQG